MVDLSLGKSPLSSALRSIPRENLASTGHDSVSNVRGQRTETRFSSFFDKDGDQIGDRDEDKRMDRLLSRLKAVQGEMNIPPQLLSPENVLLAKSLRADNNVFSFPSESPRTLTRDIPVRFHAGRESLSVKKNITVRDSKRPKEKSQDRDYKQRYSVSPGKLIGGFGVEVRDHVSHSDHANLHPPDDQDAGGNRQSSSGKGSIPFRAPDRNPAHTPSSVPSTRNGDQTRDGGSPDFTNPITVTLIYDERPVLHQVWGDMPVTQLLQDAASIFGFHPPLTSIVLMLFGLQPATLRIGYLLSDPPRVTEGETILVFRVGPNPTIRQRMWDCQSYTQRQYQRSTTQDTRQT
jgi:hypothetical protein